MNILAETDQLRLVHYYEKAYLIDKVTDKQTYLGDFYGDPQCGFISPDNSFCIVGGSHCLLYKQGTIIRLEDKNLKWIVRIRPYNDQNILLLTDPWSANSAIWMLDVNNLNILKVSDFPFYQNKEYTEEIIW